jgi:DNA-binding MarR family transcriptional regulator
MKLAKQIQMERNTFLASKNLLPGHDDFLLAIGSADGITMGALAEALEITPSSTTKIAVKMEAVNLLRREPSRVDSRQNHALLTAEGVALVSEIISAYKMLDDRLLKTVKSKEIEKAFRLFDRIEADPSSEAKKPKKAGKKKLKTEKTKKTSKKNKKKT